jgi:ParB/RepB/Spo0J family partition protein
MAKRTKPTPAEQPVVTTDAPPAFTLPVVKTSAVMIPLHQIAVIHTENHRAAAHDNGSIKELAQQISSAGQRVPVWVHERDPQDNRSDAPYILIAGFRRYQAVESLGLAFLVADVYPASILPSEVEVLRSIENLHRQNLNPAEEVIAVARLLTLHNNDRAMVASVLGKSEKWVTDREYLTRLCPKVMQLVADGVLPLGHARLLAQVGDHDEQRALAGWTVQHDAKSGRWAVDPIDKLRTRVEDARRSLKTVPWRLEVPFAGKVACQGCPSNTCSDPVLFGGLTPSDDKGTCLNEACFQTKTSAADKAKEAAAKAVAKKSAKGGGEVSLPQLVREATPAGMKPESVQRFVQKALEQDKPRAAKGAGDEAGDVSEFSNKSQSRDDDNRRRKFGDDYEEWKGVVVDALMDAVRARPMTALMIRLALDLNDGDDSSDLQLPRYGQQFDWKDSRYHYVPAPVTPGPALARLHRITQDAQQHELLGELAKQTHDLGQLLDNWNFNNTPPDALRVLCGGLGVAYTEPPVWKVAEPATKDAATKNKKKSK